MDRALGKRKMIYFSQRDLHILEIAERFCRERNIPFSRLVVIALEEFLRTRLGEDRWKVTLRTVNILKS